MADGPVPIMLRELGPLWHARTVERFWTYVDKTPTCWLWTGLLDRDGYGRHANRTAHRASWVLAGRALPPAPMHLDHLCRVRTCVNPDHLEPVTPAENTRRSPPANKTHCVNGHAYTPANTYFKPSGSNGKRHCRRCNTELARRRKAERLALEVGE